MYSHLRPLPLYGYSDCIHTPLMPIHENKFGELISQQIHAAHVFQENIPGELFMYWFRPRGYVFSDGASACFFPMFFQRDKSTLCQGFWHKVVPYDELF